MRGSLPVCATAKAHNKPTNGSVRLASISKAGQVEQVIARLKRLRPQSPQLRESLDSLIRYYSANAARMRYDEYLRMGYGIGSGAVESAHKQVVHARMRQAGMRWSEAGARRLLALRLLLLNGDWEVLDRFTMVSMANHFLTAVLTWHGVCAMLDGMARHKPADIPVDLRARLETARLALLALFRALDRMYLNPDQIPQRLIRQLFELDADYVEALWGLDQPPGKLNLQIMLRDTLAALDQLPTACSRLRKIFLLRPSRSFST